MKKCGFVKYLPGVASILAGGFIVCSVYCPDLKGEIVGKVKDFEFKAPITSFVDGFSKDEENTNTNEVVGNSTEEISTVEETPEETEVVEEVPEPPEEEKVVEVIYDEKTNTYLLDHNYEFLDLDFDKLNEKNEDMVGYIDFPDTTISYPIVQRENDETNDYYLHRDYNGMPYYPGSIYVDTRANLSLGDDSSTMQNTTIPIFGHNMRKKVMFHDLRNFNNQSYVDEHPYGVFYNEDGDVYALEVVAAFNDATGYDSNIMVYNLDNEEYFNEYVNFINNNSLIKTDVSLEYGDKIVNIVTCSYGADNERLVVVCKATKQELEYSNNETNKIERKLK